LQKEERENVPVPSAKETGRTLRKYRILLVAILVVLTIQGWFGDTVNIFFTTGTTTPPAFSLGGFFGSVAAVGFPLVWHASEGIVLAVLGVAAFALSFFWSKARSVRILSGLGLMMIVSAALGGFLFVMSGFSNGGNSAQMGGSFIGAYAFFFMALYYSK
jgi:hypothetical protein